MISGNYKGDSMEITAQIKTVNILEESTTISFNDLVCNEIIVPNTLGGKRSSISLEGSDRDFLLFAANISDTEFVKYYLFVLRNNEWKLVINSFAIHKTNLRSNKQPIRVDPKSPNHLIRSYSVFYFYEYEKQRNPWKLKEEPILKNAW